MKPKVIKLDEPVLEFGHGQSVEDPRDGLTLFGPLDEGRPYGIRAGVVGTARGVARFKDWVQWIQSPVSLQSRDLSRPPFLGFEAVFGIPWNPTPVCAVEIDEERLHAKSRLDDRHKRVFETVRVYTDEIIRSLQIEEVKPDIWFVVIPDYIREYCRPQGSVSPDERQKSAKTFSSPRAARMFLYSDVLFPELQEDTYPYIYQEHFRNQLKAVLLGDRVASQVVLESTLENIDLNLKHGMAIGQSKLQSQIAWNLCTTAFYKVGGRPWKIDGIRKGVCYVGLVYKQIEGASHSQSACCGAQMFLDSGDGVVFRGAVGPWYNSSLGDYHLDRRAASEVAQLVIASYRERTGATSGPNELFIHGRTRFNTEEWSGFLDAAPRETAVVGISIRDDSSFKLFTGHTSPVLRGLAVLEDRYRGWLWTRGWIPRLGTYPGHEVPNPLRIQICQGDCDLTTVMKDVLSLTKLNYNACQFSDGHPITLKFADAVGEVLKAGPPKSGGSPLPFMYYI